MNLKKRHIWEKVRLRNGPNYVEAYEHKPGETLALLLVPGIAAALFWWGYKSSMGKIDMAGLMIGASIFTAILLLLLLKYRPPRSLRLFPEEGLAERSRVIFGRRVQVRWSDISRASLKIEREPIMKSEFDLSPGQLTLGCFLWFIPVIGWIYSFANLYRSWQRKGEIEMWVYALIDVNKPFEALAVFDPPRQGRRLLELYEIHGDEDLYLDTDSED